MDWKMILEFRDVKLWENMLLVKSGIHFLCWNTVYRLMSVIAEYFLARCFLKSNLTSLLRYN